MNRIKKFSILLAVIAFSFTTALVGAQVVVNTAIYQSLFSVTNSSIVTTNEVVGFPYSGFTLVDQNFMDPDTLNSVVVDTFSTSIPAMPPSTRIAYQSAKQDDGTVFTDYTTEINNNSIFDVIFFPATPAINDAFYFGLYSPGRILTVNVGIAGVYDYALTWEYYNGSSWTALVGLNDETDSFETAGVGPVTFDLPIDWAATPVDSVTSYWVRARVSSYTSVTTSALGTQAWWESGTWFVYVDSISENVQINYTLFMGGATDLVTNHQIFPGNEGIVTTDAADLELGQLAFTFAMEGVFDVDSTSGNYLTKTSAIVVDNPSSGQVRVTIDDGVGSNSATVLGVTSGEFTITVSSDGVTLTLTISGVGSSSTTMLDISDNGNSWIWGDGDTTLYFEEISFTFPSVIEDWNTSGSLATGATLTDTIEYLDTSIYSNIGIPPIVPLGSTIHGGNLWIVDSNDLYELDETDATSTISNCVLVNIGAQAITSDGTNLWYVSSIATDIIEINTSCVLQSQFDISSISVGARGIAYNTDTNRLALFSSPSGNPTLSIYQTGGAQDSSGTITAMAVAGDASIYAAEYYDGFYWVTTVGSGLNHYSLYRMTNTSDAVAIYRLPVDAYGYQFDTSLLPIDPGAIPFALQDIAIDTSGSVWNYPWLVTHPNSTVFQKYLTYTISDLFTSHLRIEEDFQRDIPGWSDFDDVAAGRSGLNMNSAFSGIYSAILARTSAGIADTTQEVIGFTPGLVYSFGAQVTCSGENNEMIIQWEESDGTPIGSATTINSTGCGAWSDIKWENQIAPALATQAQITIQNRCVSVCVGVDWGTWDGIQAIQSAVKESFPTISTNLVQNPSFEELYQSSTTWQSIAVALGSITDVSSSLISWDETIPSSAILLIETSINGGGLWSTASNGSPIPLILVNDDLTGVSLLVRATFDPTTTVNETPQLDSMLISVLDSSDFTLQYKLNDIPSLTIDDRIGTNDGIMSFPLVTNNTLLASAGPLTTIAGAITISGDASTPDLVDIVTPGDITSATIFNNDIPLSDLWLALSALSNNDIPPIMFWIITAMVVILASGSYTFLYTGSVPWTAGAMGMFTLGFINFGGGVLPFWVFFFFGVMAMAASIFSKVKAM